MLRPSLLLLLMALSAPACAITPFTSENGVLLSSVSAQDVVPISGGYRMYLSSAAKIYSATSTAQESWSLESGVRLSTSASGLDASSITSCGILLSTAAGAKHRMFYVGINSSGRYSVLSATSTDGLAWGKVSGFSLQRNGGLAFLDSPRPVKVSAALVRMFYVADSAGGNSPTNYRVFSATSTDGGLNFTDEGQVISNIAYQVSVATLTDGRTRLFYAAPLSGETTGSQILSAISDDGETFALESGVRFSTSSASAALSYPVVVRSTESFRWRMFLTHLRGGATVPLVIGALTLSPVPTSLTPDVVLKSQTDVPFTLRGEIFSPAPSVAFYMVGGSTINATGETRLDDTRIDGVVNPFGQLRGFYNALAINADGATGTLNRALEIDIQGGEVSILDNVFRPLRGGSAAITAKVFDPGRLRLDLYTVSGGHIITLLDREVAEGDTVVSWDGRTTQGNVVASGVYLLRALGPKLDRVDKIVVIK